MPLRKKLEIVKALFIFWLAACVYVVATNFMIDKFLDAIIFLAKRLLRK